MTIDLGFAQYLLPDGSAVGIVDVPGHERFIKNMLAGAGGVDVALVVIAADEGVMPQTREHIAILSLLEVKEGVIALTKCDLVEEGWLHLVEEDIHRQLDSTFLVGAPIIRVSAVTGAGMTELSTALTEAVKRATPHNAAKPFRIPVDRVFSRPGFGAVITGTLIEGTIRVGDTATLVPAGLTARVRGLQIFNRPYDMVEAGNRVAVNLAGVEADQLDRGCMLASPGSVSPVRNADIRLTLLPDAPPLKDGMRICLYLGSAEVIGRVHLLSTGSLPPGNSGYVQFRAESSFAALVYDRFILRAYSPRQTIGGGIVLDCDPPRHRRDDSTVLSSLAARERGTRQDRIIAVLQSHPNGAPVPLLISKTGLSDAEIREALNGLLKHGTITELSSDHWILTAALEDWWIKAKARLEEYHRRYSLRPGMPREEFRSLIGRGHDPRITNRLLDLWAESRIHLTESTVSLTDFKVQLTSGQQERFDCLIHLARESGYGGIAVEELPSRLNCNAEEAGDLLRLANESKVLARLATGLYVHNGWIAQAESHIRKLAADSGRVTLAQFRDACGIGRRVALLWLEYFDTAGLTKRVGDARIITKKVEEAP